jgi:hypothetical protein
MLQEEFKVPLEYFDLGFVSVIQMASNLPDVFRCVRPDGTDWKLFSAQEELPPQYSPYDIKSNKIGKLNLFYERLLLHKILCILECLQVIQEWRCVLWFHFCL